MADGRDERDRLVTDLRLGVLLWNQATDWPAYEDAARRVDQLGYDHLWAWDHLYAIFGDPHQDFFEGWMSLAAWAKATERARLGLLVGANTFRNPGLTARLALTLDHISHGRAILGIGGAWFEREHVAHGIEFGSGFGQRLDWMDEAAAAMRTLLDGGRVSSPPDGHYAFDDLVLLPRPIQQRLPIMIGGGGEKKTLRSVARYADMWNAMGPPNVLRHKDEVLRAHCEAVGRDQAEIERTAGCKPIIRDTAEEARRVWEAQMAHNRTPMSDVEDDDTFWVGTPEQVAAEMRSRAELGFHTFIAEMAAPYDVETLERWIGEVKPMVERG
jgi:alkanesulfonate monooxygenase SsuD/methylene tetrahydromethanopterin reductase-like flavin-dependent oxidoreductase (luciferase family)